MIIPLSISRVSFEIIPAEESLYQYPIVDEKNALGILSWYIKPLYRYCHSQLFCMRRARHTEDQLIPGRWLLGAILLNPDLITGWNIRREWMRCSNLNLKAELNLTHSIILSRERCNEAFSYQRWLLTLREPMNRDMLSTTTRPISIELEIYATVSRSFKMNFVAWDLKKCYVSILEMMPCIDFHDLLLQQWEESILWCQNNVSDYGGFSYRQFLLSKISRYVARTEPCSHLLFQERAVFIEDFGVIIPDVFSKFCTFGGTNIHPTNKVSRLLSSARKYQQSLISLSYWSEDCMRTDILLKLFPHTESLWYHQRFLAGYLKQWNFFDPGQLCNEAHESLSWGRVPESYVADLSIILRKMFEIVLRKRQRSLVLELERCGTYCEDIMEKFPIFFNSP
ncbi:hypothetical protein QAD02_007980 [Eretmocerus hayati]|uniref:Uncharacterized protein n=1 Tax=Eretmocerus hayati TaxID=131215 RepID=A0ACC2N6H3_9HYME|nr:hypothetical protein QAD02_007980 [Eretmocerus hayati]